MNYWRKSLIRRSICWLFACLLISILAATGFTKAKAVTGDSPAQGIQVSPVIVELNADKKNSYNLKITVTNVTAGELVLSGEVNDFRAKDETGNPQVILDDEEISSGMSFKKWVTLPARLPLKSKESKVVSINVNVPADAEAGGHYGVIRFSGNPPGQETSNVSIAASVGVLVLTRVNGQINESLKLKELFVEKNSKRSGLIQNGPFTLVQRIENNGNVHVKPNGNITVKNMFGSTVATLPLNDPAKNVLPNSTRRFSQVVKKKWLFGRFTSRLEATYGYTNKNLTSSYSFWIIPYKLILIVLLAIILLVLLIRLSLKRYKAKILNGSSSRRR